MAACWVSGAVAAFAAGSTPRNPISRASTATLALVSFDMRTSVPRGVPGRQGRAAPIVWELVPRYRGRERHPERAAGHRVVVHDREHDVLEAVREPPAGQQQPGERTGHCGRIVAEHP